MLGAMRRMVLVLALVLVSQVQVAVADDELPLIATVSHGRSKVVIRGELATKAQRAQAKQLVEQVVRDVQRRFARAADTPDPDITLLVFSSAARYREVAGSLTRPIPSDWGFYLPAKRIAIANFGQSIGNLRHELAHPLIEDDYPGIPAWLNEGVGSLYGTAAWSKSGGFKFLVNYRLRDLQEALTAGELPPVGALAEVGEPDVHGAKAGMWYAYARYVLLYLDSKGTLADVYGELRAAAGDVRKQRAVLERRVDDTAFRAWAKRLRY
jgi:hypothetical protein